MPIHFRFSTSIDLWEDKLSKELQKVVDEEKLVKITPKISEGFFKVCFILDHLDKVLNTSLWLVYLLSYVNNKLTLSDIAMLTYSLDFLYAKIPPGQIKQNELRELEEKLGKLIKLIDSYYNNEEGLYKSSIKESPLEETRYALFSINLIEDIIQDAIHYHNANLNPIVKIYQYVKNPKKIAEVIRNESL